MSNHPDDLDKAAGRPSRAHKLNAVWSKIGLDVRICKLMFKASLGPLIGIAIYQSTDVANFFTTNGFIIPLIAFVSTPLLPRMRFIQLNFCTAIAICLATCFELLAIWCSIQARIHTTHKGDQNYNSSQAAVLAVWLFSLIYAANAFKSAFPWAQVPVWIFCISQIVTLTSAVNFRTMAQAVPLIVRLLETFLSGLGLGAAVSLLVFPMDCRQALFGSLRGYFGCLQKLLDVQYTTLKSLETDNPWSPSPETAQQQYAHKQALKSLTEVAGKVRGEQEYAEKEIAIGKLSPSDISILITQALGVISALSGLAYVFDLLASRNVELKLIQDVSDEKALAEEWHKCLSLLHGGFDELTVAMKEAIEHILITLQLKKQGLHGKASASNTGTAEFLSWYDLQVEAFSKTRDIIGQIWTHTNGGALPNSDDVMHKDQAKGSISRAPAPLALIYIFYLLLGAAHELRKVVAFVEEKRSDGTLSKNRFILPSIQHWWSFGKRTATRRCDPDHLPPRSWIESLGDIVRQFPRMLRSSHSVHGLRVACAIMSIAIGFYLKHSSSWFLRERFLWALIAIILSMNRTAGISTFSYICRLLATAVSMVAAYVIWYIVDTKTAGVVVFLWVYLVILGFIMVKIPHLMPAVVVGVFAAIIMVGNALQNRKLGTARLKALGQQDLPEYKLAPQRLAVTAVGLVVAYFWTIFPYPLSEHTELRLELSSTLYHLASYNAIITKKVASRVQGTTTSTMHGDQLSKSQIQYYTKIQVSLGRLHSQLMFTKFQVILGGRFPKNKYAEMIKMCEEFFTAISVMSYASASLVTDQTHAVAAGQPQWLLDFRKLMPVFDAFADEVTSLLLTMSTHLATALPLSPYTRPVEDFSLARKMEDINEDVWHIDRLSEPGYAAFVTMTMVSRGVLKALSRQVEITRELVGVLDFSDLLDVESGPLMLQKDKMLEDA